MNAEGAGTLTAVCQYNSNEEGVLEDPSDGNRRKAMMAHRWTQRKGSEREGDLNVHDAIERTEARESPRAVK